MSARNLALALALTCPALACDRSGDVAPTSGAVDPPDAAVAEPEPKPEPKPEPESKPEPEPKPEPTPEPTPEPKPDLPAPTKAEALAACRSVLSSPVDDLTPLVRVGPRRHAIALRMRVEDDPTAADLVVAIIEGDGATWSVANKLVLHRIEGTGYDEGPPALPATLLAEDYDDDGELELKLYIIEDLMCGGGGLNTVTKLRLFDTEPILVVTLATELGHTMAVSETETEAEVVHEDIDGDGHRDVRVRYTTTDEDETEPRVAHNVWLWSKADRWRLRPASKKDAMPGYDNWGCDW